MQNRNKVLDDLSQMMTNAMGVAQGAKGEAETAMKSWVDRWLAERDFVTRDEFEAVRLMAQKAREENAALAARLETLEATTNSAANSAAKPVKKPVKKPTQKPAAKRASKAKTS